jgi:hypothetical protein
MELVRGALEELDLATRVDKLLAETPLVLGVADAGDDLLVVAAAILAAARAAPEADRGTPDGASG